MIIDEGGPKKTGVYTSVINQNKDPVFATERKQE